MLTIPELPAAGNEVNSTGPTNVLSIQRYLGKQYINSNVITFWSAASFFLQMN